MVCPRKNLAVTSPSSDRLFVYDQWNVLVEFDRLASPQYTAERTFVWGLDLSNSLHGAARLGGLLAIWDDNAGTSNMLVASDGNGNVTQVLKRSDGSLLARFEYDAYGSPVVAAETYAAAMPLRFSSKWFDAETGLGYWGYRWYHSRLGRWMSLDPIGEVAFASAYSNGSTLIGEIGLTDFNAARYIMNQPTVRLDDIGLQTTPPPAGPGPGGQDVISMWCWRAYVSHGTSPTGGSHCAIRCNGTQFEGTGSNANPAGGGTPGIIIAARWGIPPRAWFAGNRLVPTGTCQCLALKAAALNAIPNKQYMYGNSNSSSALNCILTACRVTMTPSRGGTGWNTPVKYNCRDQYCEGIHSGPGEWGGLIEVCDEVDCKRL